jgi:hypothetical protein
VSVEDLRSLFLPAIGLGVIVVVVLAMAFILIGAFVEWTR